MKTVYACVFSLALSCGALVAQPISDQPIEARATGIARQMVRTSQLNEAQYLKVRRMTIDMLTAEQEAKAMYAAEPAALAKRIGELQIAYEANLATVLNSQQLLAYKQAQTNTIAVNGR
ncbi:hypothetical protein [Hymenobacter koreensis]|uniref:DUF4168 domain-containing protein n=1 Tax=Hymenobacter koreensis TaxID=1084523 RepID=A0ABP8J8C5_9BACT